CYLFFFFQAEDGIRDRNVTGVQTCALPIMIYKNYNILAMSPHDPSLIIHSKVSFNLYLAFYGISEILPWIPSRTIELNDLPKISDSHMESGSSSKSCIKYLTSSSLCFSVPIIGENSDSTSTLIIWMEGAT